MENKKPQLKFYNSLTKQVDEFFSIKELEKKDKGQKPNKEDKVVNMYSCGPTVYSYASIGNMRAYVFVDVLKRVLKFNGYQVNDFMNVTDVGHLTDDADDGEDKMEVTARRENLKTIKDIKEKVADKYAGVFFEDLKKLNIERPKHVGYATEYIEDMIAFVKKLQDDNFAYETSKGVYFDTSKFKDYNKFGNYDEGQLAGARIDVDTEKKNPQDFALWIKAPKEHIMQWQSPWGMGYPGWHIECSAMSTKHLADNNAGKTLDIHTGGVDHLTIHHKNEIAQSTCHNNEKAANFWMHNEFLKVDGGKMSKSLGNVYTISDLEEKGFSALDLRYFFLNANFRKAQNFTWEALEGAKKSRMALVESLAAFKRYKFKITEAPVDSMYLINLNELKHNFDFAINNDLNIPKAMGILWKITSGIEDQEKKYNTIIGFDKILGLNLEQEVEKLEKELLEKQNVPAEITKLAEERKLARINKNWAESDRLRDLIIKKGYTIKDTKDGYEITKD